MIPGLLFVDDTSLVASDKEGLEKSLDVLTKWCDEWGVKINVGKSGIMHMRKKMVERCEVEYMVDGDVIPMESSYKYLGCVVVEHLQLKEMVKEKAAAGRRALSAWLNRCKAEVGDVGVGMFKKLMSALVDSTMLYGVDIWGCMRNLESIEQVQLRTFRMFFGVGTLHPKATLMTEMESLPVVHVGGKSEVCAVLVRDSHVIVLRNVSEPPSRIFLPPLLEAIREIFRSRKFCDVR